LAIVNQQITEDVSSFNEAEIRFHIIDPVLRKLGYPDGDDVFLKLEEKLEFPYQIGRRSKKDLPLGIADYRAGLKGRRGSFVIEAKAGYTEITRTDIEQAHSYAAHAKVGANFFVLCDGCRFAVFETLSGSDCEPIVELKIEEIDSRFHELENILSPENLAKHCLIKYDLGLKLCDGLNSTVKIHSGEYGMKHWDYRVFMDGVDQTEVLRASRPQFAEMDKQFELMANDFILRVSDGAMGRDADGQIYALVNFTGATKNSDAGMKLLGIDKMKFASSEKFLSCEENNPSIFESTADFLVSRGTKMSPLFGSAVQIEDSVNGNLFVSARIFKKGEFLYGDYLSMAKYSFVYTQCTMELDVLGSFSLKLLN
jgi:hypothetical protein